jgi:dephospho-CoA kinase
VLSSDAVVHDLLAHDEEVRLAVLSRFGTLDRAAIAEIVFGDSVQLAWLEHLLHPRVRARSEAWAAGLGDDVDIAVTEIPLLYETGSEGRFDAVVVITAAPEVRATRARVALEERSARLLPDEEKLRRADFGYVNEGTLEELDAFVADLIGKLRQGS